MFVGASIEFIKTDWVFQRNVLLLATQHIQLILDRINQRWRCFRVLSLPCRGGAGELFAVLEEVLQLVGVLLGLRVIQAGVVAHLQAPGKLEKCYPVYFLLSAHLTFIT